MLSNLTLGVQNLEGDQSHGAEHLGVAHASVAVAVDDSHTRQHQPPFLRTRVRHELLDHLLELRKIEETAAIQVARVEHASRVNRVFLHKLDHPHERLGDILALRTRSHGNARALTPLHALDDLVEGDTLAPVRVHHYAEVGDILPGRLGYDPSGKASELPLLQPAVVVKVVLVEEALQSHTFVL